MARSIISQLRAIRDRLRSAHRYEDEAVIAEAERLFVCHAYVPGAATGCAQSWCVSEGRCAIDHGVTYD